MKQVASIVALLIGAALMAFYYTRSNESYTSWTDEQATAYAQARKEMQRAHGMAPTLGGGGSKSAPAQPKLSVDEAQAALEKHEAAFQAAVSAGANKLRLIYWSGFVLIAAGVVGCLVGRRDEED